MAYTKQNFQSGEKLYASQLNAMDEQIFGNTEKLADMENQLSKATMEPAESVEWLNEHGDTEKRYYLPNGYEYAYTQKTETVEIKHRINPAQFMGNQRPKDSGTISTENATSNGSIATPAIEVNTDGVWSDCWVNISGMDKLVVTFYACLYCYYYYADGTFAGFYFANNSLGLTSTPEEGVNLPVRFNIAKDYDNSVGKSWKNIKYVRLMVGLSTGALDSTNPAPNLNINFERMDTTETRTTWAWRSTGVLHSNDAATIKNTEDIAALREEVDGLTENVESLMESAGSITVNTGEVLYAVGDSITYGTNVGTSKEECNANAWPTHLMALNGYDTENSLNLGISGIGFCRVASGKTVRNVVDGQNFSGADIVTVAIGINDWKTQTPNAVTVADFFAEMYYCLNKIRTDNPYCRIFYILPFNFKVGSFATFYALGFKAEGDTALCYGNTLQQFVNLIKAKFEEDDWKALNIHVIDMTKNPAITRYNLETNLGDGLHPTVECHKELAKEIARRIALT